MIKAPPSKVPPIIKSGKNTYKPEMKQAIIMQHTVLKYSKILSKDKYKDLTLYQKFVIAEKIEYKKTCNDFGNGLGEWDPNEVL